MADPFGIVSGSVGIAAAFTACVNCFEYIQLGRSFGRDFQTDLLLLGYARLRLSRWGEAVGVYDDPHLGVPTATNDELHNAKSTLLQILRLFEDTATIARKYRLDARAKSGDDLSVFSISDLDATSAALDNKMRQLAVRRQKGSSILKTTMWALYHGPTFKTLIESIIQLISNLETMFPAPQQQARLVNAEVRELHDKQQLSLLAEISAKLEDHLSKAANESVGGHRYVDVLAKGQSHAGDLFVSDWQGSTIGKSHTYEKVVVEKGGKALSGNQYGGKGFWD